MGSGQNSSEEVVRDLISALQNYSQVLAHVCKSIPPPPHQNLSEEVVRELISAQQNYSQAPVDIC